MAPRNDRTVAARFPRHQPLALLALAWLALPALAPASTAERPADVATSPRTHEWRPCWLPGDPEEPTFDLFAAPWGPVSPRSPGLFVALDPVTRLPVRPSAEQRRALSAALLRENPAPARPDVPLPTERLPGGGELVHLPEGFQVFLVARRNAQGGYSIEETTDPSASTESHPTASPPPPVREER